MFEAQGGYTITCNKCKGTKIGLEIKNYADTIGQKIFAKCTECDVTATMLPMNPETPDHVRFPFGKHKDKTIREIFQIDRAYLQWFVNSQGPESGQNRRIKRIILDLFDNKL